MTFWKTVGAMLVANIIWFTCFATMYTGFAAYTWYKLAH